MATTITKTIGTTGRNYSTLQAWEDAAPANLVTADEIWRGEAYNDSQFTAGVILSGSTTDATRYKELTVASGQSFQDSANVRTNALTYNQSNGVGIYITSGYEYGISIVEDASRASRFQIKSTNTTNIPLRIAVADHGSGLDGILKDMIVVANVGTNGALWADNVGGIFINIVALLTGSTGSGLSFGGYQQAINCTLVRSTANSAAGIAFNIGTYATGSIIKNCAAFNFSTVDGGTYHASASSGYNATNLASGLPGSNNQHSVTFSATTPFTQAGSSGTDLRPIAATALAGNGSKDTTNAPSDITSTARATACTIGVWELVSVPSSSIKTINNLAIASVKTVNGLAIASVKTIDGLS